MSKATATANLFEQIQKALKASKKTGGGKTENLAERAVAQVRASTTKPTPGQEKIEKATKSQRAYRHGQNKAATATAAVTIPTSLLTGSWLKENNTPPKNKQEATAFEKAFSEAHNAGEETFEFEGKMYTTEVAKSKRIEKSKGGKIVSLLDRLFAKEVGEKTAAKKAKAVDASRVDEALEEKLREDPMYLEELTDEEFNIIMDSVSPKTKSKLFGGDEPQDDMFEMMQDMSPSEAAQNLQFFNDVEEIQSYTMGLNPQQTREFLDNVPEEDYDLFGGFENMIKELGPREVKAEGGSLFVPPEMPVDTYSNIPEDEMDDVMASQKSDAEVETDYVSYVMSEVLDESEIDYINSKLEADDQLSQIFDKLILSAAEFDGEGKVEGPGDETSDDIPARLSDGEFVFTAKATEQLGADNLQKMMDDAERAYDGGLMRKAEGGLMLNPYGMQQNPMPFSSTQQSQMGVQNQMLSANRMPSLMNQ